MQKIDAKQLPNYNITVESLNPTDHVYSTFKAGTFTVDKDSSGNHVIKSGTGDLTLNSHMRISVAIEAEIL